MKKLILASVFTFVGLTVFAHGSETVIVASEVMEITQDDFSEIEKGKLPEAVVTAFAKNYPTATINKAYVNDKNQYKLEVSLEDGTSGTLYADENGSWIELE